MGLNKFNNLKVKPGAKSSRFVVDLKRDLTVEETREINNKKDLIFQSKLEKLAELNYGKILKAGGENAKNNFVSFAKMARNRSFWIPAFVRLVSATARQAEIKTIAGAKNNKKPAKILAPDSAAGKFWRDLDQLAFAAIIKLIIIILKQAITVIYIICYWAGWIIIFGLRLVYFLLLAIIKPIIKTLNFITARFRTLITKKFNFLPRGYRATKTAALIRFMKLARLARPAAMAVKKITNLSLADSLDAEALADKRKGKYNSPCPLPARTTRVVQTVWYQGRILKPILAFAGVLLIMVLPVKAYTYYKTIDSAKGRILGASESAINDLISGGQAAANLDFNQADENFTQAGNNFLIANNQLEEINGLLFTLAAAVPDKNIQLAAAGKHLIKAGALSAAAGKNLSLAVENLFNYQANASDGILLNLSVYGHKTINNLIDLNNELAQINSEVIPSAYQSNFILLKQKTGELNSALSEFIGLTDKIEIFLGGGAAKRYLLVFQNNSELRATGGFIGSFALVDFLNGKIKNIEAPGGGSYDTEAGLLKKIKSPEPLSLVRPDWHFWDANWWPDWPASARKLAWFYENSDGPTVDGVIGFTPTVMEKILKIIGPIDLKNQFGVVIDADNFWPITQALSEQRPEVTKQPKKIIGDLMNKIIEELPKRLNKNNLPTLLKAAEELLSDKNILFYFSDNVLQTEVENLGWAGKIKDTAGDYLSVINTNIAGGKSDRKIKQQIFHQAQIQADGAIIDSLTIKRTHEAVKREPFSGVRNIDWLRIYVPLGSELIQADGFKPVDKIFFKEAEAGWQNDPDVFAAESLAETDGASGTKIYNEFNKTVFANWSQLDPGETIEINIKYKLPFNLTDKKPAADFGLKNRILNQASSVINPEQKNLYSYSLLAQIQPGMNSSTIESELKLSDNFQSIWQYPTDLTIKPSGWLISGNFEQDKLMAAMMEEK